MDVAINSKLHPAVIRAGLLFNRGVVTSSNMRCQIMLDAFKQMITSYEGAADKELRRDLEAKLRPHISFLTECRPMSVSMRNAVKFLKLTISNLDPGLTDEAAKSVLLEEIDHFLRARIELAVAEISKLARDRIVDGDVIVTFSAPQAVETALVDAWRAGRRFSVHVIDTRAGREGRGLIERLSGQGVPCAYSLIHGAADAMKDATKVFLGAHTFFANGYMMAPCGAAVLALAAKAMGRPVLVCCETYKFWAQRVQTDSFVFNELGMCVGGGCRGFHV
jgi:translation initiation factor eIF-2B subunit delta